MKIKFYINNRITISTIIGIMISASFLTFFISSDLINSKKNSGITSSVDIINNHITDRIENYVEYLYGVKSFFEASDEVTRSEFQIYINSSNVLNRLSGTQAIEYIRYVPESEISTFEENTRNDTSLVEEGYPNFSVWRLNNDSRTDYFVVDYIEPIIGNENAFGFDLGSNPSRLKAIENAIDSGLETSTGPIILVQEHENNKAFLLLLAIYKSDSPLLTIKDRRNSISGFVLAVFRYQDMITSILESIDVHFEIELFDTGLSNTPIANTYNFTEDDVIYDNNRESESNILVLEINNKNINQKILFIDIGGRRWLLNYIHDGSEYIFDDLIPYALFIMFSFINVLVTVSFYLNRSKFATELSKNIIEEQLLIKSNAIDSSITPMLMLNSQNGLMTYSNNSFRDLWGFKKQEDSIGFLGIKLFENQEEAQKILQNIISDGFWRGELIAKKLDNSNFYCEIEASIIKDEKGNFTQLQASIQDITERRLAEESQRNIGKELRQFIETANAPIFGIDTEGNVNEWNENTISLTGYSKDDIFGQNLVNTIITEDFKESVEKVLNDALQGKETSNFEFSIFSKSKKRFDILLNATTRRDISGNIVGVIGVGQDITERRLAENEILQTRNSLAEQVKERTRELSDEKIIIETILETIPNAILVVANNGESLLINRKFKEVFSLVYNLNVRESFNINNYKDNILFKEILSQIKSSDKVAITIEPIKGKFFEIRSEIIQFQPGEIFGQVIEFTDVTPFKEFDNLRRDFVSTVSHELRTPITSINLAISTIQKYRSKLDDFQLDEIIQTIAESSKILKSMIEDLLIISRIEVDQLKLEKKELVLCDVIENVIRQQLPNAKLNKNEFITEVKANYKIKADSTRIEQVFRIIIDNAVKYSKENSKIKISCNLISKGQYLINNKPGYLVKIENEGIGIKKEDLDKVFERFYRSSDVKTIQGTGLGLDIAKSLVLLHDGEIYVESEYQKNTTFSVYLPI